MEKTHPFHDWRKAKGKTLIWVADQVGCNASFLSEMENWKKTPGLALAVKLSALSGIPIEQFAKVREAAA